MNLVVLILEAKAHMDTEHVKNFIERNLKRMSGVASLAADLNVQVETLRKKFRKDEGIAISKYITLLKVEHAKKLLNETEKFCFEVCYEVGFPREDGGSRTFKRITGMTMREYREGGKEKCLNAGSGMRTLKK